MFSWQTYNLPKYFGREGVVRPYLVEYDHYKILEALKGAPDLSHLLYKNFFLVITATWKKISKIIKLTKIIKGKGQSDPQKNGVMWL